MKSVGCILFSPLVCGIKDIVQALKIPNYGNRFYEVTTLVFWKLILKQGHLDLEFKKLQID
jgi:hypothetical protein